MEIVGISLFTWLNLRFYIYSFIGIINSLIAFLIKLLQILFLYIIYKILSEKLNSKKKKYF